MKVTSCALSENSRDFNAIKVKSLVAIHEQKEICWLLDSDGKACLEIFTNMRLEFVCHGTVLA